MNFKPATADEGSKRITKNLTSNQIQTNNIFNKNNSDKELTII